MTIDVRDQTMDSLAEWIASHGHAVAIVPVGRRSYCVWMVSWTDATGGSGWDYEYADTLACARAVLGY